jgi:hypothetical protein
MGEPWAETALYYFPWVPGQPGRVLSYTIGINAFKLDQAKKKLGDLHPAPGRVRMVVKEGSTCLQGRRIERQPNNA